ncbi:hypothetical protein [Geobacillus stearothermophilus]
MHKNESRLSVLIGAVFLMATSAIALGLATLPFFHVTGMMHSMHVPIFAG